MSGGGCISDSDGEGQSLHNMSGGVCIFDFDHEEHSLHNVMRRMYFPLILESAMLLGINKTLEALKTHVSLGPHMNSYVHRAHF